MKKLKSMPVLLVSLLWLATTCVLAAEANTAPPQMPYQLPYQTECYIPEANFSIIVPPDCTYELYNNDPDCQYIALRSNALPDTTLFFLLIRQDNADDIAKQLSTAADKNAELDMQLLLESILPREQEDNADAASMRDVLRQFQSIHGYSTSHLFGDTGDWVLDAMLVKQGANALFTDAETMLQTQLLRITIDMASMAHRSHEVSLSACNVSFSVPEDTFIHDGMLTIAPGEYELYISRQSNEAYMLVVRAFESEAYAGNNVHTISAALLADVMNQCTQNGYDPESVSMMEADTDIVDAALFESNVAKDGTTEHVRQRHVLFLKNGWAFSITALPLANQEPTLLDMEWAERMSLHIMLQILGIPSPF